MDMLVSLVSDVEDAVRSGDSARRIETLRRVTDLFVEQAGHLADLHVALFDEVILRLARGIEFRVRADLSEQLADIANAPRKVLRDLAFDDAIDVARPVIERSPRLDEEDLAALAAQKGQAHLLALSRRARLSERVTEILVDRGDAAVVENVCRNEGAALSVRSLDRLDARILAEAQMSRLVEIARARARRSLADRLDVLGIRADVLDDAFEEAADLALVGGYKTLLDDFAEAALVVESAARAGRLDEDAVLAWIREGRIDEALAAMAHLAQVPAPLMARAFHASHYDPLLFIVRALRFSWVTLKALLAAKAGRDLSEEVQRSAHEAFERLSTDTARRILRFTAARERAAGAEPAPLPALL